MPEEQDEGSDEFFNTDGGGLPVWWVFYPGSTASMEQWSRSKHTSLFTCRFKPEHFADANFDAAAYVSQLRRMVRLWCSCSCQADSFTKTFVFGWCRCHLRH